MRKWIFIAALCLTALPSFGAIRYVVNPLTGKMDMIDVYSPIATPLTADTTIALSAPRGYAVCTNTCNVTPPVPAAGYEFCIRNANNSATAITLVNISGVQYEATDRASYYAANRKLVSGGAATDQICIVGLDATHYLVMSSTGTWTDTAP